MRNMVDCITMARPIYPRNNPMARTVLTDAAVLDEEMLYRRGDGTMTWLSVSASPIRDLNGEITGAISVFHDIAARKRAQEERDRFFNLSLDMLSIAGMDGFFTRVNPAFSTTLGWTEEEIVARPFLELVHPEDIGETMAAMAVLGAGTLVYHFKNRYLCSNGDYRWLEWTASPEQQPNLLYCVARDIHDQYLIEAERERQRAEIEDLNARLRRSVQASTSLALLVAELVSNALKHGQGQIEISVTIDGDTARLEVDDDGPGFPADFDWRQAANTGLGLIDSAGRHDLRGTVSYGNRPEGGACVTVTFPIPVSG